jgi:hypothetical protein
MGTSGLVSSFDPMGNGKEYLCRGLMQEIVDEMFRRGFVPYKNKIKQLAAYHRWTHFNPEGYKVVLDELVANAGVEVRLFTKLIDADAQPSAGMVRGVMTHDIEGYRYITARLFVDATGDAVLADLAGAACRRAGRDTPHIMPPTLTSIYCGMHRGKNNDRLPQARRAFLDPLQCAGAAGLEEPVSGGPLPERRRGGPRLGPLSAVLFHDGAGRRDRRGPVPAYGPDGLRPGH